MDNSIYFCIPSYKRANKQKTLALLDNLGVPKERIVLSLQTQQDMEDYGKSGAKSKAGTVIYREGSGVAHNRNTILNYFPRGQKIVMLDDDIRRIKKLQISKSDKKRKLIDIENYDELLKLCNRGFAIAAMHKTVGFGLNIYTNAMFMEEGYAEQRLCSTEFFGLINTDLRFDEHLRLFEDTDMCARIIKRYGAFIGIKDCTAIPDRYTEGGCHEAWFADGSKKENLEKIKRKHGDILEVHPEIGNATKLKRKRKK